jgi:PhzF family phenazine biosynthesis protein
MFSNKVFQFSLVGLIFSFVIFMMISRNKNMEIFTGSAFIADDIAKSGNPAGLYVLDTEQPLSVKQMQEIAKFAGYAETSFVRKINKNTFDIQWYSRNGTKIFLCGHATMVAAHNLFKNGQVAGEQINFLYDDGREQMRVYRKDNDEYAMKFTDKALEKVKDNDATNADREILAKLFAGKANIKDMRVNWQEKKYYLFLHDAKAIKKFNADSENLAIIAELTKSGITGLFVSAQADANDNDNADIISRNFGPAKGIDEDIATGSAHKSAARYWCDTLSKREINSLQYSKEKGRLKMICDDDIVSVQGKVRSDAAITLPKNL